MLIASMEDEIRTEMTTIQPELDRIKRELLHEHVAASGSLIFATTVLIHIRAFRAKVRRLTEYCRD